MRELDSWDQDWLSRSHSSEEYRRMCKELFERCAAYAAEIDRLRSPAGCGYPDCIDRDGRCSKLWAGECSGPKGVVS